MAAMFYIMSIYFCIKTRQSQYVLGRIMFLLGCMISFTWALAFKQNTATLSLAVILIEIICFQNLSLPATRRVSWTGSIMGELFLIALSAWLFVPGDLFWLAS
jgi:hypothetical protein